ncbi:MAG: GNAT family N-acetyltransferase [Gammaproteobacteria bacterium]|nr:GNAT family N-acetyltransferase [Gammaproteobacteria bacterium]
MKVCESERLLIEHFDESDCDFIIDLLNQPSFIKNIADKLVRTHDDAIKYLTEGPIASYEQNGFGLNRVVLKETNTPIGMCGILKRPQLEFPDIGYAFLPDFWHKGYAIEAAEAALNDVRITHHLSIIQAVTNQDNVASIKLLQKLDFQFLELIQLYPDIPKNKLFQINLA